jgi:hypothetical protein
MQWLQIRECWWNAKILKQLKNCSIEQQLEPFKLNNELKNLLKSHNFILSNNSYKSSPNFSSKHKFVQLMLLMEWRHSQENFLTDTIPLFQTFNDPLGLSNKAFYLGT